MARGNNPTKGGPIASELYHAQRKERLVASGDCVWMIHAATGNPAAVRNDPTTIERKKLQGFVEAELVEEVVKRPVVKAASPKSEPKEKPEAPKSKVSGKGGE